MTTLPRIPLMKIDCNANRGLSTEQMRELDPVYQAAEASRIEDAYLKSLKEDIEKRQNKLKELTNSIPSSKKKKINKSLKRL